MQGKHKRNRNLVAQQPAMLELLETPQLIDTCVRTNNYDEALDLIAFANKVAVVAPDVPVVTKLTAEVAACQQALLEQLLSKLSGNVSLPECLRCVSYLRRLPVFTEGELRLRLLQCREQWCAATRDQLSNFQHLLADRPSSPSHTMFIHEALLGHVTKMCCSAMPQPCLQTEQLWRCAGCSLSSQRWMRATRQTTCDS